MQQIKMPAPFLSRGLTVRSSMLDVLLCFSFLLAWSVFSYGIRTLLVAATAVLSCMAAEYIASRLARLPHSLGDFSAIVSGLVITLLCPVTVPLWIVCLMSCVAMLLAKAVFGGLGHNPFNPAAAAIAFGIIAWPEYLLRFPVPFQTIHLFNPLSDTALKFGQTVLSSLKVGGTPNFRLEEILYGTVPSAMGASALIVIVACFAFLVIRKTIGWRITLSYLITVAVLAMIFPRVGGPLQGAFYELTSGYLLFAAVFVMTDPSTAPKSMEGRLFYGIVGGILTILFRFFGTNIEGICFAVLITNALGPTFDRLIITLKQRRALHDQSQKPESTRIYRHKKA